MSWLKDHAISPPLASRVGVRGKLDEPIHFHYRDRPTIVRTRMPDGRVLQPKNEPLRLYWPVGGWGSANILLLEGEGDALAAASVLCTEMGEPRPDLPEVLAGLCPVGLPGVGMPSDRVGAFLRAYGASTVYLCLDGDIPGQQASQRLAKDLDLQGIRPVVVEMPNGKDLSDCLVSLERATASGDPKTDWLANLLADSEAEMKVAA